MATHERELTIPVDLCTPDGSRLNPEARGWSRHPLHRANLHGEPGRNKRWDYWAVVADDAVFSCVYADVDVVGLADCWWADLTSGASGGAGIVVGPDGGIRLPERPGTAPLHAARGDFELDLTDDDRGTRITGAWTEPDGRRAHVDLRVDAPEGHESLNVVVPWDDRTFNYTSKHQARPAHGELTVGDRTWRFGGGLAGIEPTGHGDAWGILDVGRGRWPSSIVWNWGGGAGRCGDHVIGLQFGAKWTAGTGFTENGLLVDGQLSKLGAELDWDYDWEQPMRPWRVRDPHGQLDVVLTPRFDKHSRSGSGDLTSETHQVFGTWSGTLRTDDGLELDFDGVMGFAEEARQHW